MSIKKRALYAFVLLAVLQFTACGGRSFPLNPFGNSSNGLSSLFGSGTQQSSSNQNGNGTPNLNFDGWSAENGPSWLSLDDQTTAVIGEATTVASTPQATRGALSQGIPVEGIPGSNAPANLQVQQQGGTVNGVTYDAIVDWGHIPAGKNPLFNYLTARNTGGQPAYIKIDSAPSAPFSLEAAICYEHAICSLRFTYAPNEPGKHSQTVNLRYRNSPAASWTTLKVLLKGSSYEQLVAYGPGEGGGPHVLGWNPRTNKTYSFWGGPVDFKGGVRVAVADFNGDGVLDIAAAQGPGGAPTARIYYGPDFPGNFTEVAAGYDLAFKGGTYIAACDLDGDKKAELIFGAGEGGGAHIWVKYATGADYPGGSFFAFDPNARVGARVACGDVNGDGTPDIISSAGEGGGPVVAAHSGKDFSPLTIGWATDPNNRDGVSVGFGYFNPTSPKGHIVTGVDGQVVVWKLEGNQLVALYKFFPYTSQWRGNITSAGMHFNKDWIADMLTGAGEGGGPHALGLDLFNLQVMFSFFTYNQEFRGGIFVSGQ
ncbi:MAG: VCBS repeat-containing protein [Bdellovibrionota bacterium]